MSTDSNDWRETERRLNELPDEQLRKALENAGVKAVLPSHKKPRSSVKVPGRMGEATNRWASGDWEERISVEELPDFQKFLADPSKPPTLAMQQSAPLSSRPAGTRPWRGLVWGLVGTATVAALAVLALRDSDVLERPQITARSVSAATAAGEPLQATPVVHAPEAPGVEQPGSATPGKAVPAGSAAKRDESEETEHERRRLKYLVRQATEHADVGAMLSLARAMLERGDAERAMKWAGRARRVDRDSIDARILLGDAQMLAGYGKAAERTWRGALHRAPGNAELKKRLGE